jgi:hypothetical protein
MTPAISVTGLTRRYRDNLALDQVSLEVEAGSISGANRLAVRASGNARGLGSERRSRIRRGLIRE